MIAPRYLVLIANLPGGATTIAERVAARTGLQIACQSSRIAILVNAAEYCVKLETGEGGFIGHVFTKGSTPTRLRTISRPTAHAILASADPGSLENVWGAYVAVWEDAHRNRIAVTRDPSGGLPCYKAECQDITVFSSDPKTLYAGGLFDPVVDQALLRRHLCSFDICTPETCLDGLIELLPGTRFEIRKDKRRTTVWWSPWRFASDPLTAPAEELAACLRETVDGCLAAWGSCCDSALVSLSGGLDSSIVTSALSRSGVKLTAFTMVGDDADGDERRYARRVAGHFGIDLFEARYDPAEADVSAPSAPHLPRPLGIATMQPLEAAARHFSRQTGADAHFNGFGGDSIFCSIRSALGVTDSVKARRSLGASLQTARDTASIADVSLASVMRQTVRMLLRGRRSLRPDGVEMYLRAHPDSVQPFPRPPWLDVPKGLSPGRAHHVEIVARLQHFLDGFDRWTNQASFNPLFSQPILELCFGIPSWQWVRGGINRSIARLAFAPTLPPEIVERRSKGGPDAFATALCLNQLERLREQLLEGQLARRGVIDRFSLEQVLTRASLIRHGNYHEILLLADAEAWFGHWSALKSTAAPEPVLST